MIDVFLETRAVAQGAAALRKPFAADLLIGGPDPGIGARIEEHGVFASGNLLYADIAVGNRPSSGQCEADVAAKIARLRNVGVVVVNHEVFDPRSEELMLPDITPQPGEIGAVIYLAVISLRADVGHGFDGNPRGTGIKVM